MPGILGFAHRGGSAHSPENTLAAFTQAQAMGAGGVETDAWLTADDEAVLHHDGWLRIGARRRRLADLRRDQLPEWIPTLADLYAACGTSLQIAIDVLDPAVAPVLVRTAVAAGGGAPSRLWLCDTDIERLAAWRRLDPAVHLVWSDPDWKGHRDDLETWCRALEDHGVEVLNLRRRYCSAAVANACHRHRLRLFAWGVQRRRSMRRLLSLGVDGLMSDHVDRLVQVLIAR